MADFTSAELQYTNAQLSGSAMQGVRNLYQVGRGLIDLKTRYQSGDTAFKAVVDSMYTSAQFAELGAMVNQIQPIIADWEANHKSAIGLPP